MRRPERPRAAFLIFLRRAETQAARQLPGFFVVRVEPRALSMPLDALAIDDPGSPPSFGLSFRAGLPVGYAPRVAFRSVPIGTARSADGSCRRGAVRCVGFTQGAPEIFPATRQPCTHGCRRNSEDHAGLPVRHTFQSHQKDRRPLLLGQLADSSLECRLAHRRPRIDSRLRGILNGLAEGIAPVIVKDG